MTDTNGNPITGYDGEVIVTSVAGDGYSFTFNAAATGLPTIVPVDDGSGQGTDIPIGATNSFATGPVGATGVTQVIITFLNTNIQGVSSDGFVYANGIRTPWGTRWVWPMGTIS